MRPSENWNENTPALAQAAIGYTFQDRALLQQCFTHKSFADNNNVAHNERLEFLGDAVLQLVVSEALDLRADADEGSMTEARKRFVSREALTKASEKAGILEFLRYAGGADTISGKTASNLFEAVTAGIYLDGGMKAARTFLKRFLVEIDFADYKSLLQEYVQEHSKGKPQYETCSSEDGYTVKVRALNDEAEGFGKSKKQAEAAAAENLLKRFKESTE